MLAFHNPELYPINVLALRVLEGKLYTAFHGTTAAAFELTSCAMLQLAKWTITSSCTL